MPIGSVSGVGGRRACPSLFTASAEPLAESPELLLSDTVIFLSSTEKNTLHSSAFQNPSFVLTTLN